jgi:hypothetical protein
MLNAASDSKEAAMDARETAERHGGFVVAGDMRSVGADFVSQEAMQEFMSHGKVPPRPTTKAEVVSERQDGDDYIYEIKYSNDQDTLTVRSQWSKVGDDWKIVKAEPI